jgi:hypothetical protein
VSPSPPNTTITLYVDPTLKGSGITREHDQYRSGAWVAILQRGRVVVHLRMTEASTREEAEATLRQHLGMPRRTIDWQPTSPAQKAWTARVRVTAL